MCGNGHVSGNSKRLWIQQFTLSRCISRSAGYISLHYDAKKIFDLKYSRTSHVTACQKCFHSTVAIYFFNQNVCECKNQEKKKIKFQRYLGFSKFRRFHCQFLIALFRFCIFLRWMETQIMTATTFALHQHRNVALSICRLLKDPLNLNDQQLFFVCV